MQRQLSEPSRDQLHVAPAIERVYRNSQETGAGASGRCTCFPDPGPELVIFS